MLCFVLFSKLPKSLQIHELAFLQLQSYLTPKRRYDSCRSRQQYLSELPKSFQQQELTFLLTLAFTATKILSTVGVDIYRLQLLDLPTAWKTLCFPSTIEVENVAFRATLKRKTLCFCQLTQLTTIASRATKILSN